MRDVILIDANSLGHASHRSTVLKAGNQETQAVFGFIKAVRVYRVRYPNAQMLFLWDGLSWRKAKSDVYKTNRTDTAEKRERRAAYETQAPYIRLAINVLGLSQLSAKNLEADDLAAMLSRKYAAQGRHVRLLTGDQDWLQLVTENVIWEDHRDDARIVNPSTLSAKMGYDTIEQFVQSKALQGDESDHLPGVGGVGPAKAKAIMAVWGDVRTFLADPSPEILFLKTIGGKTFPKALRDFHSNPEQHAKFAHNMEMMDLRGELPAPVDLKLSPGDFDPERFKKICQKLAFGSLLRPEAFKTFLSPFNNQE